MRLVRYGRQGSERAGLLDAAGRVRSVSPLIEDWTPAHLVPGALDILRCIDLNSLPLVPEGTRLGVPVGGIRQIFAVGLNYVDHSEETGMPLTNDPLLFGKSISALSGPGDELAVPQDAVKLDWEIELAVVIGTRAKRVSVEDSLKHVAGLCLSIDFSERGWQFEFGGQHGKGKSYDGFTPMGPCLTTLDEFADHNAIDLELRVNGDVRQKGNTASMVFDIARIVAHISRFQTLMPGDVIQTGTPAGVAFGMEDPIYLKVGDLVSCSAGDLGSQSHRLIPEL